MTLLELADRWRQEASQLRHRGDDASARRTESLADDLVKWLRTWWLEPLSPAEAAEWSGYDPDSLSRLEREGQLPNLGNSRRKAYRRCDLPRHPSVLEPFAELLGPRLAGRRPASASEARRTRELVDSRSGGR